MTDITTRLRKSFEECDAIEARRRAAIVKRDRLIAEYARAQGCVTLRPEIARSMVEGRMERKLWRVA